jgi:ketosteroid isomerase-like protein
MQQQQNLEIVRRGYDAFTRGDIPALLALLSDDVAWTSSGPPELPTSGVRRGHAQVGEFFAAVDAMHDFQRFEPATFVADGDHVVVLGSETTRMKATNAVLEHSWAHAFTLRDGKITAFAEYADTAAIVAELRSAQARA